MMEAFFRTHAYLVEHTNAPVRRLLMDEIDWNDRMIGIKGTRGVGKTTFLLQYAKENFDIYDRKCLYVNMNNFYFQGRGIADFAGEFYKHGGKVLLVDQIFKETDWSAQLRKCHDLYPDLKIVFTAAVSSKSTISLMTFAKRTSFTIFLPYWPTTVLIASGNALVSLLMKLLLFSIDIFR